MKKISASEREREREKEEKDVIVDEKKGVEAFIYS